MEIQIVQGDITRMEVDAIVNAANNSLMGGGGVDGAIHRAGGPAILEACKQIVARQGGCPTGGAVITTGGNLPAKFVIHTVGPVWRGGKEGEAALLGQCYTRSLQLAVANDCRTVAFPNISTGVYGYPKPAAAKVAMQSVLQFSATPSVMERVVFVCYDAENYQLLLQELQQHRHG
jgi:O-acetyl-ADP-ribose deacetylase (regulator of RNase III)